VTRILEILFSTSSSSRKIGGFLFTQSFRVCCEDPSQATTQLTSKLLGPWHLRSLGLHTKWRTLVSWCLWSWMVQLL